MEHIQPYIPLIAVVGVAIVCVVIALRVGRSPRGSGRAAAHRATASLYGVEGPYKGVRFHLNPSSTLIGRLRENDIQIDAPLVSRVHTLIRFDNGIWRILDQESTNGTWVNGRRVADQSVRANDQIQIGPAVFAFQLPGDEHIAGLRKMTPRPQMAQPSAQSLAAIHDLNDYERTPLGRGGEGMVYRGISRTDSSVVAIKVLESQDPFLAQKFQQTGKASQSLHHPHIVETYRFGNQGGTYYIIMECAERGSLKDRMSPGSPFPLAEAIRIIGQTCEALDYAHLHEVVHRDVKPSNILFDRNDQVKLSDFGIAKLMTQPSITQAGMILGTPEYMSYEQARGQTVVPESDGYSLGVVAYELLTGHLPFTSDGRDMLKILDQHLTERPRPLRQLNPALPPQIESAVLKALEKDVAKRFRTCMEFARALGYRPTANPAPSPSAPIGPPAANAAASLLLDTGLSAPIVLPEQVIDRMLLGGDVSVSRRPHARIMFSAGRFWLRDENSTNGTRLNGQPVGNEWVALHPNDTMMFGNVRVRFVLSEATARSAGSMGPLGNTRPMG